MMRPPKRFLPMASASAEATFTITAADTAPRAKDQREEASWQPLATLSPRSDRTRSSDTACHVPSPSSSSSFSNCPHLRAASSSSASSSSSSSSSLSRTPLSANKTMGGETVLQIQEATASSSPSASASASALPCAHDDSQLFSKAHVKQLVRRHWPLSLYLAVIFGLLVLLFYLSFFGASIHDANVKADEMEPDSTSPQFIGCREWAFGPGNCGDWGVDCRPFDTKWMAFRCPTRCAVDQSSALAVYGTGTYRADSRICRAAIHAGVIGGNGGCALLRYSGSRNSFVGSSNHGVTSRSFDSWFPKTFEFRAASSVLCTDLSFLILAVAVVAFIGLAWFEHAPPLFLFELLMVWGLGYVRLIGQSSGVDYPQMAITFLSDAYVVMAVSFFVFFLGPVHTFKNYREKTRRERLLFWGCCYVIPFHLLLHMNYVAFVPWLDIDIGGFNNDNVNAGTFIFYGIVLIVIVYGAIWLGLQIYRQSLWKLYVVGYAALIVELFVSWLLFNSTSFHLHHVMIGVFLVPLTRFPSKRAAAAQAMLLGCFIQGYAAWGWSDFLEAKPVYLTIPVLDTPARVLNISKTSAEVTWDSLDGVDGYSVLLNYVEVYRGINNWTTISPLSPNLTYFVHVRGVASWGTNGGKSPVMNFTTTCC